jgi:hypothetical protein
MGSITAADVAHAENLIRLAYLGVTNVFALLRLLPVSRLDEDAEILALRHQFPGPAAAARPGQGAVHPG